jgi:hypothetical protein
MWSCTMPQLPEVMEASLERNKTPLLIDCTALPGSNDALSPLETFYSYAKGYEIVEMKKVCMRISMHVCIHVYRNVKNVCMYSCVRARGALN